MPAEVIEIESPKTGGTSPGRLRTSLGRALHALGECDRFVRDGRQRLPDLPCVPKLRCRKFRRRIFLNCRRRRSPSVDGSAALYSGTSRSCGSTSPPASSISVTRFFRKLSPGSAPARATYGESGRWRALLLSLRAQAARDRGIQSVAETGLHLRHRTGRVDSSSPASPFGSPCSFPGLPGSWEWFHLARVSGISSPCGRPCFSCSVISQWSFCMVGLTSFSMLTGWKVDPEYPAALAAVCRGHAMGSAPEGMTHQRESDRPAALRASRVSCARVQAGQKEYFYRPHQALPAPPIFRGSLSILRNEAEAEDARAGGLPQSPHPRSNSSVRKLASARGSSQIAVNEALMRRRKAHAEISWSPSENAEEEDGSYTPRDFADWREIPSESLSGKEIRTRLANAVAAPEPRSDRQVFVLRDAAHEY